MRERDETLEEKREKEDEQRRKSGEDEKEGRKGLRQERRNTDFTVHLRFTQKRCFLLLHQQKERRQSNMTSPS